MKPDKNLKVDQYYVHVMVFVDLSHHRYPVYEYIYNQRIEKFTQKLWIRI
jgi:hypothetical protein